MEYGVRNFSYSLLLTPYSLLTGFRQLVRCQQSGIRLAGELGVDGPVEKHLLAVGGSGDVVPGFNFNLA